MVILGLSGYDLMMSASAADLGGGRASLLTGRPVRFPKALNLGGEAHYKQAKILAQKPQRPFIFLFWLDILSVFTEVRVPLE